MDEEKGTDGDDTENKPSEDEKNVEADTKLEVSTVEEKKGFEIRSKVVKILANFKPKEKKMTEELQSLRKLSSRMQKIKRMAKRKSLRSRDLDLNWRPSCQNLNQLERKRIRGQRRQRMRQRQSQA